MSSGNSQRGLVLMEQFSQFLGSALCHYELRNKVHHYYYLSVEDFPKTISWLVHQTPQPVQLVSLTATDERQEIGCFRLYVIFQPENLHGLMTLVIDLDAEHPTYPAITPFIPSAEWYEREIHDLFGIIPSGIELSPLILHRDWPKGNHYPLRKDFAQSELPEISEVPHQFDQPQAAGAHQVAVGPIHAGIIEPGHLRFCVTGEDILHFDVQLFYTHKGIEKMAEGQHYRDVLILAEHVCGLCSFAHSSAYCQALESLGGIQIPKRALMIRCIGLELERLASHFADLSAICSAGGFGFGSMQVATFREQVLVINHELSGNRFLRHLNDIGGLKRDIPQNILALIPKKLQSIEDEFQQWIELVLHSDSLLDRLEGTGFLSVTQAKQLGLVGPSARGSGLSRDIRWDLPYGIYHQLPVFKSVYQEGDALARARVRMDEAKHSFLLIKAILAQIEPGIVYQPMSNSELPQAPSIALIESAKGELAHWILMDKNNQIARWHVRSASYLNWRGVVQATMGNNIVPDGPLVNKSFNLCYACTDR